MRRRVPDHDLAIGASQGKSFSIGVEGDAMERRGELLRVDQRSAGGIPKTDFAALVFVVRRETNHRGERPAGRIECHAAFRTRTRMAKGKKLRPIKILQVIPFPSSTVVVIALARDTFF